MPRAGGREECVMALIVQKFGGSSVKDAERINNVADIVTSTYKEGNDVVVVVSAQGDTTDDLIAKAAEINDRPSKREMDMLLSSGEQISAALLAMAIERMGYPGGFPAGLAGWLRYLLRLRQRPHQAGGRPPASSRSWISAASWW